MLRIANHTLVRELSEMDVAVSVDAWCQAYFRKKLWWDIDDCIHPQFFYLSNEIDKKYKLSEWMSKRFFRKEI